MVLLLHPHTGKVMDIISSYLSGHPNQYTLQSIYGVKLNIGAFWTHGKAGYAGERMPISQ